MNIECEAWTESGHTIVVSFDPDGAEFGMGASVGLKRFKGKPGSFEYDWTATDLSKSDLSELLRAVLFVLDHMPDESDVCGECAAEAAQGKEA